MKINILASFSVFIGYIFYLIWRYTILNPNFPVFSATYYAVDIINGIIIAFYLITTWRHHYKPPVIDTTKLKQKQVDILIPTYKEPLSVITKTLAAAKNINYPCKVFVLDDGNREDVKALAKNLKVNYLARGNNKDAKAGNLNFGLQHSTAEFFAVFDADHIPQREAITILMSYFTKDNIAMVQSPQDYYNTDALQYFSTKKKLWHDQSIFYNCLLQTADFFSAATCVGTGVLYKRKAIDDIGGIPTDTMTEDMHTSLKLHIKKWHSIYYPKPVAYGIAAADNIEYFKTRHRWAHGNLEALRHEGILFNKDLTITQKIFYLSLGVIYLEGWSQLILFIIPTISLILGWQPFIVTPLNVLIIFLFPFLSYMLLQEASSGYSRFWPNELFAVGRFPIHIKATLGLFKIKTPWLTSNKNIRGKISWLLLQPQLIIFALSLLSIGYGIYKLHPDYTMGPIFIQIFSSQLIDKSFYNQILPNGYTMELFVMCGFWALFNIVKISAYIFTLYRRATNNVEPYMFKIQLPGLLQAGNAIPLLTSRISEQEFTVDLSQIPNNIVTLNHTYNIELCLPSGKITAQAKYLGIKQKQHWFCFTNPKQQLTDSLYSVFWHRYLYFDSTPFLTIFQLSTLVFKRNNTKKTVTTVLYDTDTKENLGFIEEKNKQFFLFCFRQLPLETKVTTNNFSHTKKQRFVIASGNLSKEILHLKQNLDNITVHYYQLQPLT